MVDPLVQPWTSAQVGVMERLRDWEVASAELNRHLSHWMSLPVADCAALAEIIWAEQGGEPLSPVRLARRIGMTTGATTALLHRLEAAGYLTRSREHDDDRRRVTLRPTPAAVENARGFLAQAGQEIAAVLLAAEPDELAATARTLERLTGAARAANHRLDRRA